MSKRYSVRFGSTIRPKAVGSGYGDYKQKGPGSGSSIIVNATGEKDAIKKAKATKDYTAKRDSYKSIVRQELNSNEKMRLQHKVTELKPKLTKPKITKVKPLQQTGTQFRQNINVPRVGGLGGGGMAASAFRKIIK